MQHRGSLHAQSPRKPKRQARSLQGAHSAQAGAPGGARALSAVLICRKLRSPYVPQTSVYQTASMERAARAHTVVFLIVIEVVIIVLVSADGHSPYRPPPRHSRLERRVGGRLRLVILVLVVIILLILVLVSIFVILLGTKRGRAY